MDRLHKFYTQTLCIYRGVLIIGARPAQQFQEHESLFECITYLLTFRQPIRFWYKKKRVRKVVAQVVLIPLPMDHETDALPPSYQACKLLLLELELEFLRWKGGTMPKNHSSRCYYDLGLLCYIT